MNKRKEFTDMYGDYVEVITFSNAGEVTITFKEPDKDPVVMAFNRAHAEHFRKIADHLEGKQ